MQLTLNQRRFLRGKAHDLTPIILIGNAGLTEAVAKETTRALQDHELIKVKGRGADRDARNSMFEDLAQRTGSALIHRIGHTAVLYKPHDKKPTLIIPDA